LAGFAAQSGVFAPIRVICDPKSTLRSSYLTRIGKYDDVLSVIYRAQLCVAKFLYDVIQVHQGHRALATT